MLGVGDRDGAGKFVVILNRVVRVGLLERVAFEKRVQRGKRSSFANVGEERSRQRERLGQKP